ncbi:MAG: ribosome biogenesis GTPase Der [Candidatus Eisenbacteria bacterium]|nr:ribosome biogenesis GTPase Der [Candidatus Eisenbacteria bacterium]MCC7141235.1 ribosome biogenesis GTPase Der [Candidatus Eisenbacteria bacterium]
MSLPVVAIIGRPNVGKSTFFNRVVGQRIAVVDDHPGITRDRLAALAEWNGYRFRLFDTGGWVPDADDAMDDAILTQVLLAVEACDFVVFLVDARAGLHPHDRMIAHELFRRGITPFLVANKADHDRIDAEVTEFAELGIEPIYPVAAAEGRGVADFLDALVAQLPPHAAIDAQVEDRADIRVAIVGRPNVGKSSLTNRLLGEDRMIVDNKPGTTRDAVDAPFKFHGRTITVVDTAGIRRRLDSQPKYEFYATLRAVRSIDSADVAVLVLDASEEVSRQDLRIASLIEQAGAAAVIAINKWDLPDKDDTSTGAWIRKIEEEIPFLSHAPILFISALTTQRIHRLPEAIVQVYDAARREVPTATWNDILNKAVEHNPPRSRGSGQRPVKIYYVTQVRNAPPTVALFCSEPKRMAPDYLRYLAGKFRETLGFEGSPIRFHLRKS